MSSTKKTRQPFALLKTSVNTLFSHSAILFPYIIIMFVELLIFEILLFAPRYPLVKFFGPIISRLEGAVFLHYPFSYYILAKWFQNNVLQSFLFMIFNSVFIGTSIAIINAINGNQPAIFKAAFKRAASFYVHLFLGASLPVATMLGLSYLHQLVIARALIIRSTTGMYFIIKQSVLISAPYMNLLLAVFSATLFIYVFPAIIVDKKKFFPALAANFKTLWKSFWFTFFMLLLPALLYLPMIVLQSASNLFKENVYPELFGALAVIAVLLSVFIDAIHYTTMTTYYLLKKEEQ